MGSTRQKLICHPSIFPHAVRSIYVDLEYFIEDRRIVHFNIDFEVVGDPDQIRMAGAEGTNPIADFPTDGLWQTTCFELFTATRFGREYFEYNFAGDGRWASYRFANYRDRVESKPLAPRAIGWHRSANGISFTVAAPFLPIGGPDTFLGLSAVIEEIDGTKSYWALRHPLGAPDFHHRDCFALRLGAPDAT